MSERPAVTVEKTIVKRIKIHAVKVDWLEHSHEFRAIRDQMRDKMRSCWKCGRRFKLGETMGFALSNSGNVVLCCDCANAIEHALALVQDPAQVAEALATEGHDRS